MNSIEVDDKMIRATQVFREAMTRTAVGAFVGLLALLSCRQAEAASEGKTVSASDSRIIVLDNCDSDYKTPPFEDSVTILNSKGKATKTLSGFNICQTVGGHRAVSASEDGELFVVCENVADKLTLYEMTTGKEVWSLDGEFSAAVISKGLIYALTSAGTIYGDSLLVIDSAGKIVKQAKIRGFDIALDSARDVLWLVGADIKKCDLDLNVLTKVDPVNWCAVSVDVNPDGSVWVAERKIHHVLESIAGVTGSKNRLLQISPSGGILKTIDLDWTPMCVRVNRADGSLWATGRGFSKFLWWTSVWGRTHKYDSQGKLLLSKNQGGFTIDIDPTDGSVWLVDLKKMRHYSKSGAKLGAYGGISTDQQKYVVVSSAKKASK